MRGGSKKGITFAGVSGEAQLVPDYGIAMLAINGGTKESVLHRPGARMIPSDWG